MPWYIYIALKQLFPSGRRVSFIFLMSVCGVMLGVMILVIVQSVMGGFGEIYRDVIVNTNGHIRINSGKVMYNSQDIINYLERLPEVEAAEPYAQGPVMLQHGNRPAFPYLRGFDVTRAVQVVPIGDFLVEGNMDDLDDESILLSSSLASQVGAGMGSTVDVYTPLMLEGLEKDEVILPRELLVVGLYETGWVHFDSNTMVCTLRLMQELYGLEEGVHGVALRLKENVDEFAFAKRIQENLPPPNRVYTWMDLFEDFLWVLKLEKNMMFFLLFFIVIVAAFVIANAQLLTVIRKTHEIGLLGALGGTPRQLAACYCFQGFFIGMIGTVLGIVAGLIALYFRNDVIHAFARLTDSREVLLKFYQFSNLPAHYAAGDFIAITLCALVLTTLAGLIPAWRVARMNPAEALRYE